MTLSVTIILSTILVLNSRSGEQQVILFKDQARVTGTILRSKSLALQTFKSVEEVCGYGVHIVMPRTFILFKDIEPCDSQYSGVSENVEVYELDSKLAFTQTISDILFLPPDPTVIINPDQEQALIVISRTDGTNNVTIKVNRGGQVSGI